MSKTQFSGFASIIDDEIVCFCAPDLDLGEEPPCRKTCNCSEAYVAISVLPNSRPSDDITKSIKQLNRNAKQVQKGAERYSGEIKKGLATLEKSIKHLRWKI